MTEAPANMKKGTTKRLVLGSVVSAGLKITSAGLTFLMFVLLARVLGPEEYGAFAAMFALAMIGAVAALFGQHTLSIKTIAALGDAPEAVPARRRVMYRSLLIALAGIGVFIAGLFAAFAVAPVFGMSLGLGYLIGAAVLTLPYALAELIQHQHRGFGAIFWALAPRDVIWRGGVVLICLGAGLWPFVFADALTAMVWISLALLGIVGLQFAALLISQRKRSPDTAAGTQAEMPDTGPEWRSSTWMWLASLGTLGASLNLTLAAPYLEVAMVGAYFAAQKTSQLLQLPLMAVKIAATPLFARLYRLGDFAALRDVARRLILLIAVPLTIGVLIIGFFAEDLLALFDPSYASGAWALMILAGSYLCLGLGGPARQLMLMSNGERDLVRLTLYTEAVGLALVPILVPFYGIVGAAIAALIGRLAFTIVTVSWCRRHLGVDPSALALLRRKPD